MININTVNVKRYGVLVAGSGAAGLNAADTLYDHGIRDLAIITEGLNAGTSRNTGSDKQTYYKLSLGGNEKDSVRALAETLFDGGSTDGDLALVEAAASVPCFMKLARLGVPFPKNSWGEYVGYKTDHDPARRATSAGPYTSKFMTEALESQVLSKGIKIFDNFQIVKILTRENRVAGLLCLDLEALSKAPNARKLVDFSSLVQFFTVFLGDYIIMAAGGPAAIYDNTVYPESQNGAQGAAFEAGAMGRNLTEWQYGLAGVKPRWNVSGTFMQVLPRFISTNAEGSDEKEFLFDNSKNIGEMLSLVFLKGYQWPFDVRKVQGSGNLGSQSHGSSIIDILVYRETAKGRRVFLDYRENPLKQKELDFSCLTEEARSYLETAGACFGTPYERLVKMNSPAADFFRTRGIDLGAQPLEIALCAQHNNGGLAVDHWWRTNLEGLFAAGEAAATHGVYRPGGAALNAGQAGSSRAALFIARELQNKSHRGTEALSDDVIKQTQEMLNLASSLCTNGLDNAATIFRDIRKEMSIAGGAFRDSAKINEALETVRELRAHFSKKTGISKITELALAFRLRDTLICQEFYLTAMADYTANGGKSRGSSLYTTAGQEAETPEDISLKDRVQEIRLENNKIFVSWRDVRPIPPEDISFELVWGKFREENAFF